MRIERNDLLQGSKQGIGNERPTGRKKNDRQSAGKDEEPTIITLVLSYRPAAELARDQQGCHCCLSGGHRARELLAN